MEIGTEKPAITIEPLENPVPSEQPEAVPDAEPEPVPVEAPELEPVPA